MGFSRLSSFGRLCRRLCAHGSTAKLDMQRSMAREYPPTSTSWYALLTKVTSLPLSLATLCTCTSSNRSTLGRTIPTSTTKALKHVLESPSGYFMLSIQSFGHGSTSSVITHVIWSMSTSPLQPGCSPLSSASSSLRVAWSQLWPKSWAEMKRQERKQTTYWRVLSPGKSSRHSSNRFSWAYKASKRSLGGLRSPRAQPSGPGYFPFSAAFNSLPSIYISAAF